ncbi:hypothetical protein MIR68_004336 [Amoeboaphelidium protococcarum]|nr:hypothetical protein MIR68_004336 [Amoeboaphelidium protococcarum]
MHFLQQYNLAHGLVKFNILPDVSLMPFHIKLNNHLCQYTKCFGNNSEESLDRFRNLLDLPDWFEDRLMPQRLTDLYSISIPYKAGNPVDTATEVLNDQFGEDFADLPGTAGWDEEDVLGADIIDLPDDEEQQRQQLLHLVVDEEKLEAEAEGDNRWDWLNDADYSQSNINEQTILRIGVDVGVINFAVAIHVRASSDANALQVLLATRPRDSTVVYQTTADYFHRLHSAVGPRASLIRDQYSLPRRGGNLQQFLLKDGSSAALTDEGMNVYLTLEYQRMKFRHHVQMSGILKTICCKPLQFDIIMDSIVGKDAKSSRFSYNMLRNNIQRPTVLLQNYNSEVSMMIDLHEKGSSNHSLYCEQTYHKVGKASKILCSEIMQQLVQHCRSVDLTQELITVQNVIENMNNIWKGESQLYCFSSGLFSSL